MSDHSWVHVQVVLNIALRLIRLLDKGGIEPAMVSDHGMKQRDAEVVVAAGALLHDDGDVHPPRRPRGLQPVPGRRPAATSCWTGSTRSPSGRSWSPRSSTASSATGAAASPTRSRPGWSASPTPSTWPRAARGIPVEGGQFGIHALSAAAIDEVAIEAGDERPVRVEIEMNNSAGIFQVDDLLATKIRGTPLEGHVEVIAEVEGETEKRLLPSFRI